MGDITGLLASLVTLYNNREATEDRQDAIVDTIIPEVARYFAASFKEEDADTIFGKMNQLIAAAYVMSPGAVQFFLRFLTNMSMEKIQGRWPAWATVPLMVFTKAYLGALEEATRDKPKPTKDEIESVLHSLGDQVKSTASDLGAKFSAAVAAAKHIHIPHFDDEEEGAMSGPDPAAAPSGSATDKDKKKKKAAGGTGKSGLVAAIIEWIPRAKEELGEAREHLQEAIDGAEGVAGWIAFAIIILAVSVVGSGFISVITAMLWPGGVCFVTWALTLGWGFLPLLAGACYLIFGTGNGFAKLGAVGLAVVMTGSISSLVIAGVHGIAAFSPEFSWVYVGINMGAIVLADFLWRLGDMSSDAAKAIIRIIPDSWEAQWLKDPSIGFRKIIFTLAVADTAVMFLIGIMAQWEHTLYGVQLVAIVIVCLLMAAYGYSRVSLTINDASGDLEEAVTEHRVKNLNRFYWAATGLSVSLFVGMFAFNVVVPPTKDAAGESPSYAARWEKSGLRRIGESMGEKAAASTGGLACSKQIQDFAADLEQGDCEIVLTSSSDKQVIALCKEAVECGAVELHDGDAHGSSGTGFPGVWICILLAIILVVICVFTIIGWNKSPEEEDGKKKSGGGKAGH